MTKLGRSLHSPPARGADDLFAIWCRKRASRCRHDALAAGLPTTASPCNDGGTGAMAYADAVAMYLGVCGRQGRRL